MYNGLVQDDKKMVEPFNLVGRRALIYTKEEAVKSLKDNSYYIFVAAVLNLGISFFLFIYPTDVGISKEYLMVVGIFYCALAVGIRKFKSRIASLLALASFGYVLFSNMWQDGTGGFYLFTLIFFAAAFRTVKASFYYHKSK